MKKFEYNPSQYDVLLSEKIKTILEELFDLGKDEYSINSSLEDLGLDSLDFVELLMAIEKECGIYIPDEEAIECSNLGELVSLVNNINNGY
jgi:acyl carrier protein